MGILFWNYHYPVLQSAHDLMITFYYILYILGMVIWVIVPIRQVKETFFLFFLALAAGDIAAIIALMIARFAFHSHSNTNIFYVVFGLLCLISIQDKKISKLSKIFLVLLCIIFLTLELYGMQYKQEIILISFIQFLLLLKFLKYFIFKLVNERLISIFLICLIFYELTLITKLLNLITGFANVYAYFFITTFFEIFIGLFFCIFKEDNPRILIKLKNFYDSP